MPHQIHPRTTLLILTALNFFNYIDRSILFAVQPLVQHEFHLSDKQVGMLSSAFFIFYMLAAPFIGPLADRWPRKLIIVVGSIVWSGATLLTALTHDYQTLFIRHIIVGVGEATFVTVTPSYIADLFPEHKRGRMLAVFYLAIPVGTACGYLLGGWLGPTHGWRMPFYVAAAPGILLAIAMMFMQEPDRGRTDTLAITAERSTFIGLFRNKAFWTASLGMAFLTFALGGLQVWMPTFLNRLRGVSLQDAGYVFGGITVVAGIFATLLGGWLGDHYLRRTNKAYYLVSAIGMLIGLPTMAAAIYLIGTPMYVSMFLAEFFLLLNTGPLNAAIVNSVSASIRGTAIAVNLLTIHLLGDAFSPTLIGWVSDRTSLQTGCATTIVAIALSAAVLLYGMRFAPSTPAPAAIAGGGHS
jgi:multidrug resistance protein